MKLGHERGWGTYEVGLVEGGSYEVGARMRWGHIRGGITYNICQCPNNSIALANINFLLESFGIISLALRLH